MTILSNTKCVGGGKKCVAENLTVCDAPSHACYDPEQHQVCGSEENCVAENSIVGLPNEQCYDPEQDRVCRGEHP